MIYSMVWDVILQSVWHFQIKHTAFFFLEWQEMKITLFDYSGENAEE